MDLIRTKQIAQYVPRCEEWRPPPDSIEQITRQLAAQGIKVKESKK
ncbi:hypothetical protein WKW77_30645 [Variovorax ureilyticus]|uniref:Uncharacterized protein n=1 Tax=Variovorax ureilyticus TaxID=1836198 RepID=A0ABU8VPI8_9BURK